MSTATAHRILIVDDNQAIHDDFRKVLSPRCIPEAALPDILDTPAKIVPATYDLDFADQGCGAVEKVRHSLETGRPYALAFVDMRMPPGWDGVETISRLWDKDPQIQVAICTAYSDYSWRQILDRLGCSDRLLILKKPFDAAEVCQLACAMTQKWTLARQAGIKTAELERLVRQRTAHLQGINDDLRRKNQPLYEFYELQVERNHLRDSVQAMEQVLGIIGHELRTPLGCIRGLSEMVLKTVGVADESAAQMLSGINKTAREMAQTLDSLLEAARLNSGLATWNWSTFSLGKVCWEAIQNIRPVAANSPVRVVQRIEPLDATMCGDPDAIRRLLVNLLNNADKYTSAGTITVSVGQIVEEGGNWINLKVIDTGAGIGPEVICRLGEPFALNRGVVGERCVQGAGLGIAICKSITQAHGGSLQIESTVGSGTTVTARLRQDLGEAVPVKRAQLTLQPPQHGG